MNECTNFFESIINKGGPEQKEYSLFEAHLNKLASVVKNQESSATELRSFRNLLGNILTPETIYGHIFCKPYGYAGDFEIIDKIYRHYTTDDDSLKNWDIHAQTTNAAIAVRNRKGYFISLLQNYAHKYASPRVLNVASGPGRDILDFFVTGSGEHVFIDCVECDPKAISYASNLCRNYLSNLQFIHANVLKFKTEKKYDLIWSAGLFDYFDDQRFKKLMGKLLSFLAPGGEVVIGNFSENNPTRNYMEIIGNWMLHHRSRERLIQLAEEYGVEPSLISVKQEAEGINLFLHLKSSN